MSWIYNCFHTKGDRWRERELGYIKELNKATTTVMSLANEKMELEERYRQEYNRWQSKEDDYLRQVEELRSLLHQQEVVTKQYQIYEGNFKQDRLQLQEVQKHIEEMKRKIDDQQKVIEGLTTENRQYLNALLDCRRDAKEPGESDSGYCSEINGPHITKAVLV